MKVHLIDGTYELFRAHFAVPAVRNASGQQVGAARGLAGTLIALLRDSEVSHVACAFDHVIESFRNQMFDGYKTGAGLESELYSQFELAERVSRALGVVTWPMVEFEADDALATAAFRAAANAEVQQVLIGTPDKDLAQCVRGQRVVCWDRRRDRIVDEAGVVEKFGVPPSAIPSYLALVGDPADGIPGVPRWGPKSAARVLSAYGSLTAIPLDAAQWKLEVRGAAALAQSLAVELDRAKLYQSLAELRTNVPLAEQVPDLLWAGPRWPLLEQVVQELEQPRLLDRMRKLLDVRGSAAGAQPR